MTEEKLWAEYVKKNPQFDEPGAIVRIPASGLKKLFSETFKHAHEQGMRNNAALERMKNKEKGLFPQF